MVGTLQSGRWCYSWLMIHHRMLLQILSTMCHHDKSGLCHQWHHGFRKMHRIRIHACTWKKTTAKLILTNCQDLIGMELLELRWNLHIFFILYPLAQHHVFALDTFLNSCQSFILCYRSNTRKKEWLMHCLISGM